MKSNAEYALLAVMDLAAHYRPGTPEKVADIAARTGAPAKYLAHILLRLRKRALVRSMKGRNGGHLLMRRPDLISVAEVLDAIVSDGGSKRRASAQGGYEGALDWLSKQMEESQRGLLSSITLADLAERAGVSPAAPPAGGKGPQ